MNLSNLFGKIMGFIVIIITLALAPSINTANEALLPDAVSENFTSVVTVVGVTTAPVTLTYSLYSENVSYGIVSVASSISENGTSPTLSATAYDSTSQNLTVAGLSDNTTRTLAIGYKTGLDLTQILGVETVASFGAPLIILLLLVSGGMFAMAGVKGKLGRVGMGQLMGVIGSVIVVLISLTLFQSVITYTNTLIDASTGFATTIYGVIPLVIYIGIIGGVGYFQISTYRKATGGKRSKSNASIGV